MARTVRLDALRSRARVYSDQRTSDEANAFITSTELNTIINDQLAELYDLLLSARGQDYYITSDTLSIVAGTTTYSLPADFYQLKTVTLEWGTHEHELVEPINSVAGRAALNNDDDWTQYGRKGYRLRGTNIEFLPEPSSAVTCRLQYVPTCTVLTNDSDTFDGVNGWDKLVSLGAAMEMLEIEEEGSSSRLQPLYDRTYARIEALAADRDADQPMQIEDVRPDGVMRPWYQRKVFVL